MWWFGRRDVSTQGTFLRLRLQESDFSVELTVQHLIRTKRSGFVFADQVTCGHKLLVRFGDCGEIKWDTVEEIHSSTQQGAYHPLLLVAQLWWREWSLAPTSFPTLP